MKRINEVLCLKKTLNFVLFMALLLNFSITGSGLCQSDNSLKKQFENKISEWLGVAVHVNDYRLEYATIHLSGIQIGDSKQPEKPHGQIDKLSVTCDFMSLLGGKLILNDISLGKTNINLTRNRHGTFFPDKPKNESSKESNSSFADLPFLNLSGNSITINLSEITKGRFVKFSLKDLKLSRNKDSDKLSIESSSFLESGIAATAVDASLEIGLKLALSGFLSKPDAEGTATVKKLKVKNAALKQEASIDEGIIKINDGRLQLDELKGKWGKSAMTLSGEVKNISDFSFRFSYAVNPIMLEEFSQIFVGQSGITFSGQGSTSGSISGSRKSFNLVGELAWPSFKIEAPVANGSRDKFVFPFKNVASSYSYNGRQMNIENASAEIFSGKINGNGSFFYRSGLVNFDMNLTGTGLRTEQFLGENSSQKNIVSGPVNAYFKASGDSSGLTSMNGSGNLTMLNGRYQTPPVVTPLLSMVNLKEFSSGEIQSGNGTFALKSGILHTSDLLFVATAGRISYQGHVGLDTSLKGNLNIVFTEESVNKSRALQQISLDGKTASIPSKVEGTLFSPSFPGFSAEKLLELGLKRTGQKILIDVLTPRKKEPADDSSNQKKKEPKKILNDLKKIFKF